MKILEINEKFRKNQGVILTKLLISHSIIALEYQTWYQSKTKTQCSHHMGGYKRNQIWKFINLKKILEINEKSTKLLISHLAIALEYQTWYQSNAKT